jgi:hypothetical protein
MGYLQSLFSGGPLGIIYGALILYCLYHAISRRSEPYWFFLILFIPAIGGIAYFVMEVLPDLRRGNLSIDTSVFQSSNTRILSKERALEEMDTLDNRMNLAREYKFAGRLEDAKKMLESVSSIHQQDPYVRYELADLYFRESNLEKTREILTTVLEGCPEELRYRAKLLLARTLDGLGDLENAEKYYREATTYFTGEEARARLAQFLIAQNRKDEAKKSLEDILRNYKRSANVYQRQQREWFDLAGKLLKEL